MLGELNEAQIDQVLRSEVIGRLGCHAYDRTYIVPVTYAYDGDCIYGHSAQGMKVRMMRANPNVCFEVDDMESSVAREDRAFREAVRRCKLFEQVHNVKQPCILPGTLLNMQR